MRFLKHLPLLLAATWMCAAAAFAEAPDFNRDIRPILSENCFHCHGPDAKAREASLRLDTFEGATTGGEFANPVVPGEPENSEVIDRIHATDPDDLMPPPESKRSLTERQKNLLRDWIASGAKYEDHWAWISPKRPAIPEVQDKKMVANPVDAFVLHRLEAENLTFSDPAAPETIFRRLSLDLIGIPPTPAEVSEFRTGWIADRESQIANTVDRLLASPRFGERWARPWLDLARYADSNGFQADQLRPSWAYRDWVIDALNANMAYDQFTIEQLAGDLLPEATISQKVATGFHRTVTCNVEAGVHPEQNRTNQVVDRVNTTGTTWLGITMECAQCHDHKYDPFSMQDYYSLLAFFNNTPLEVSLPSGTNDVSHDFIGPYLELPLDEDRRENLQETDRRIAETNKKRSALLNSPDSGFDAWEASAISDPADAATLPKNIAAILRKPDNKRTKKDRKALDAHFVKSNPAIREFDLELTRLKKERNALVPDKTLVMVEMNQPRPTHIMNRGDYLDPRDEVHPGTPDLLPSLHLKSQISDRQSQIANRLDLARWIVRRDNPLTARVAVNRWWAELFGTGIVATQEDFGTQAEPPSHPDLLDWLAVEFMDSGWDMKHVLKTIVLSNAYQQSSRITPELLERDPRNLLIARAPRFRMDAERLRDNALAVSGLLSDTMHGKPIMPYQPPGLWRQTGRNEPKWIEQKDENRWRRGIYIVYRRAAPYPSMVNFDAPDRGTCTVKRPRTNTPSQALTLLNDPAYVEMALALADRVLTESPSPADRIDHAFQLVLSRDATEAETQRVTKLLDNRLAHFTSTPMAANEILSNPTFVYKPKHANKTELATWLYLANTLLNLDETMTKP